MHCISHWSQQNRCSMNEPLSFSYVANSCKQVKTIFTNQFLPTNFYQPIVLFMNKMSKDV